MSAEPNYDIEIETIGIVENIPNDYYYYNSFGEISSTWAYEALKMEDAWDYYDLYLGKNEVNVGILDTGIYGGHEEFRNNETQMNKIADFGIAYAESEGLNDENRINEINYLKDVDGHGTGVSGIIAAQRQNQKGIAGVCNDVKLVSLRIYYPEDIITSVINCLEFAETNDVRIINCSNAWYEDNTSLRSAISNYSGLLVCGSGNSGRDNDDDSQAPAYPASYNLDNIISVGAIDKNNNLWIDGEFETNTGKTSVDLFAPGDNIISTGRLGGYNVYSGTSFAAPFVTGVAAMVLSIEPTLSILELKATILNNVTKVASLTNSCVTGGILNAESAIKNIHHHSYTYVYDSALYHRGECSCGAINIETHTWKNIVSGGKTCLKCGGTSLSLNYIKKEEEDE